MNKLIGMEGAWLLWELREGWDPTDANVTRRLSPHRKQASWSGNQLRSVFEFQILQKNVFLRFIIFSPNNWTI